MAKLGSSRVYGSLIVDRNVSVYGAIEVGGNITITGTLSGILTGNGAGITSLNASNIASGTISADRIPSLAISKIIGHPGDIQDSGTVFFSVCDGGGSDPYWSEGAIYSEDEKTKLSGITAGTLAEAQAGTVTGNRTWTPQILKQAIEALSDLNTNNYLTGVSGSGNGTVTFTRSGLGDLTWNASHSHNYLTSIDDRDIKPNDLSYSRIQTYFSTLGGLTGTNDGDYQDLLVLNTCNDSSGGDVNLLAFDKSEQKIRHYLADQTATTWGTPKTLAYSEDVVALSGNQTIAGTKTFSSTISGSISGNAGTVTNGVYTTGAQSIAGVKTFTDIPAFNGGTSGTSAPFTVNSTFKVSNLNADLLDDKEGSYYAAASSLSNYLPLSGGDIVATSANYCPLTVSLLALDEENNIQEWYRGGIGTPCVYINNTGQIASGLSAGAPFIVSSTTRVDNLNADLLDDLSSGSFFRSDTSNSVDVRLASGDGRGLRFWDSDSYKIWMSGATNGTYGGRISGETTSDYNMYFRMASGTNRGFVFESAYGTKLFSINPDGVRTAVSLFAPTILTGSTNTITGNLFTDATVSGQTKTIYLGTGGVSGSTTNISIGSANGGTTTIANNLIVSGNLTINGTTTTINATTIAVDDKNIELGSVATPTDTTADGGGITLKGATEKTITWKNIVNGIGWHFNQDILPDTDNTGAIGNSTYTWSNGQFTNLTVDTTLTASTINVSTAIDLSDNDILRFGASDDWEFYHNGTDNYIDLNVGNLLIRDNTTTRFTFERTTGNLTTAGKISAGELAVAGNIKTQKMLISNTSNVSKYSVEYNATEDSLDFIYV